MSAVRKVYSGDGAGPEFVLSDETVDRYGDVVVASGWDLADFQKNPVVLFGHNPTFPIGKWSDVRVEGTRLVAKLNLAARGTSARIDELISLVEQGILRAVSVGFRPIKSSPIDPEKPMLGQRYLAQELLEASLVAVPANPAALALAKSLNISEETVSIAFGKSADARQKDAASTGKSAEKATHTLRKTYMRTLSERIEDAQNDLVAKRDMLAQLTAADEPDLDAIEELNTKIGVVERTITALKASEAKIGLGATVPSAPAAPAVAHRPLGFPQKEVNGFDLLVRGVVATGCSRFGRKSLDQVLDERYPGHEATAVICKANQTIGTTTVSGWASQIVQTAYADFLQALTGFSIYPALRARGIGLSFDGNGTVTIPSRTAGGAGGGFVAEGSPIRVGRITTASVDMVAKKMGVIVPFSRELSRRSSPAIESLVRQAILEDTAAVLDPLLLDATAVSAARPAGLLNGVAAASVGYGGGDYKAVQEDFKALLAPFVAANAADNITVVMNSAQGLSLALMEAPVGNPGWFGAISSRVTIVESTYATAGRLIAIRNSDFATALGDAPEFDVSEQATLHMEDTTPLEIVSDTGPTTADPVRSLFQTATIGVRMLLDISWLMRRSGMVSWINGTSW